MAARPASVYASTPIAMDQVRPVACAAARLPRRLNPHQPPSSQTASFVFHHTQYQLRASIQQTPLQLVIHAENTATGQHWNGTFAARYIEDMTQRTGNFKAFPVFAKMLSAALQKSGESVFVDLLTYADLEVLKQRRAQRNKDKAPPPVLGKTRNKRYLILTYVVEFDRVHYPLPLDHVDPTRDSLTQTITRLRSQLEAQQQQGAPHQPQLESLAQENRRLKLALRKRTLEDDQEVHALRAQVESLTQKTRRRRVHNTTEMALKERIDELREQLEYEQTVNRRLIGTHRKEQRRLQGQLTKEQERVRELEKTCSVLQRMDRDQQRSVAVLRRRPRPRPRGRSRRDSLASRGSLQSRGSTQSRGSVQSRTSASSTRSRGLRSVGSHSSLDEERVRDLQSRTSPAISKKTRRFDPTAYIRAKRLRQRATRQRLVRERRRRLSLGLRTDKNKPKTLATLSASERKRQAWETSPRKRSDPHEAGAKSGGSLSLADLRVSDKEEEAKTHRSASSDIADIDKKLSALQQFLVAAKKDAAF